MRCASVITLVCLLSSRSVAAEEVANGADEKELTVVPRRIDTPVLKRRLFPAEHELREGNAATILLRLPWDLTHFFAEEVPKFKTYLEIPLADDGRIREAGEGLPDYLYTELRRAAFRRTADWEYPLREGPVGGIRLPDVQGGREIIGRGLSVWIRFQIVNGQLDEARQGILVGLANARHYARTPFIVCQLAPAVFANMMLDRLEELIQQPECPNFYWSLTAVPNPIVDIRKAFEFECKMLERSVDELDDLQQVRSSEQWHDLAGRLIEYLEKEYQSVRQPGDDFSADRERILDLARKELPNLQPHLGNRVAVMSEGELTVQWFLAKRSEISERIAACSSLESPVAIERLRPLDEEIQKFKKESGLPCFFTMEKPLEAYLAAVRFDRRVAALRVVEAIRHYAATHDGTLPERLEQLSATPAPRDTLTGKPFEYGANLKTGRFRVVAPGIVVDDKPYNAITLEVRFKSK
jgi:hypothetical protein